MTFFIEAKGGFRLLSLDVIDLVVIFVLIKLSVSEVGRLFTFLFAITIRKRFSYGHTVMAFSLETVVIFVLIKSSVSEVGRLFTFLFAITIRKRFSYGHTVMAFSPHMKLAVFY